MRRSTHRRRPVSAAAALFASLAMVVFAAPIVSAKPIGSCANGYEATPVTLDDAVARKVELGFPEAFIPFFAESFAQIDKNVDGLACIKDLPDTPGIPAWVFQLSDDVSSAS